MKVTHFFCQLGRLSAQHRVLSLTMCAMMTVVLGLGILRIQIVSNPQDLWVNKSMRTSQEQDTFNARYGAFFRINQIILKAKSKDRDLIDKKALLLLYDLQKDIENQSMSFQGHSYSIDDFCYKPISTEGCIITSPLDYWKKDPARIQDDSDLQRTLLCLADAKDKMPCTDRNGIPVIQEAVLGGITCEYNIKGALGNQCVPSAKALMVTYLLNNDGFTGKAAEAWEKEVYLATIERHKERLAQADLEISMLAERSIPDELVNETAQNVSVVVISYVVMFLYITVAIGQVCSFVHSGWLLGIFGVTVVLMSLACSVGLAGFLGIGLSMISAEVVPFLVLAIGVDNMFIISHAYRRTQPDLSIEQRLGETLSEIGPSITTAAICEFCAFIVGYFTNIPALSQFSFIAAFAVMFDYIFQIFGFVAFMAWDQQRQKDNRADVLFCIKVDKRQDVKQGMTNGVVSKYLVPVVFHKACKVVVMVVFVVLLGLGVLGCTQLDLGLEQQVSLINDSYLYKYFDNQFKYGEAGPPAYVVLEGVDYQDEYQLAQLGDMQDALSSLDQSVQPPIYDWTQVFNQFINTNGNWAQDCDSYNAQLLSFNEQVLKFRGIKIESKCCQDYGICGEQFEKDIVFNLDGSLASTRLRFQHVPLQDSQDFIRAFKQTRDVVDHFQEQINNNLKPGQQRVHLFAYSLFYIYFEQYSYIGGLALQNLLICTAVVYLVIVFFKNARSAAFTYLAVFCTSFDVVGLCYLMNLMFPGFPIQINAVSVVNLIIAVGLSVEFCVHIIIAFMNNTGSREQRAKKALGVMGSSVLVGIVVTKLLGVIVLAFASSTLFRLYYFRMYLSIIILGTFHGLFFIPVLLSLVGPKSSRGTSGQHKSEINSLLHQDKLFA